MKKLLILVTLILVPLSAFRAAGLPNIVLMMADDLGYGSLGCYGNPAVSTPNIDRLALGGMRFTDFHSNGALCSPTRAALMTGRYQQRCVHVPDEYLSPVFREQRNENPAQRWAWGISKDEVTLPAVLKQAGYRTALIGKWHLGYDEKFHPMNYGFDEFRGWVGGGVDNHTHIATHGTNKLDWWNDRMLENEAGYSTDLLTKYATEFITKHKSAPFFLYLSFGAVHTPLQSRDPQKKQSQEEAYKEVIGILDESVGTVMEALRTQGLGANTLVIFCSDNGAAAPRGFAGNGNLRGKKGTLDEGGHRVPFIASWPGTIPVGTTCAATVMTMDLLPTLAHLAGATLPAGRLFDGMNILPILQGKSREAPEAARDLFWQSGTDWAVRRGPWKLIGKRKEALLLVNLSTDIGENDNCTTREPGLVAELMKAHTQWTKSLND